MSNRAKFVRTIGDIDPDTGNHVEMDIYKHENGGMFAIDSSFTAKTDLEEDDGLLMIPDLFSDIDDIQTLYLEEE